MPRSRLAEAALRDLARRAAAVVLFFLAGATVAAGILICLTAAAASPRPRPDALPPRRSRLRRDGSYEEVSS